MTVGNIPAAVAVDYTLAVAVGCMPALAVPHILVVVVVDSQQQSLVVGIR